ncbi:hypothetical protein MHBO_000105 [Bonamia ostreae]|uniref:Uncharacterized protein n=1 Tax=Bonamia ostreae TaxID=126728 RepID=A0ABV2AF53_9EUKA
MDLIDFDNINNLNIKDNYSFTIHRNFSDLDEIHFLPKFDSIVFKGDISLTFIEKFSSNEKVYGKSERISELTFEENKFSKNYPKNFHIFNQDFDFLKIKDFSVNSDAENIKNLLIAILLTNNKIKIYECNQIANYRSWPNLENSDIWGFSLTWIPSICCFILKFSQFVRKQKNSRRLHKKF